MNDPNYNVRVAPSNKFSYLIQVKCHRGRQRDTYTVGKTVCSGRHWHVMFRNFFEYLLHWNESSYAWLIKKICTMQLKWIRLLYMFLIIVTFPSHWWIMNAKYQWIWMKCNNNTKTYIKWCIYNISVFGVNCFNQAATSTTTNAACSSNVYWKFTFCSSPPTLWKPL